jgi:O-antigen/teichoic acid export membrane protein
MEEVNKRAKRGIKLLLGRQVLLQIFTLIGSILLARTLSPALFGIYAIATFFVQAAALLGDFGLAPSFIQRKAELTDRELQVGFTLQQLITTVLVLLLFVVSPWLMRFYPQAPAGTEWLIRALGFSLYLTSWRAMGALQLERHLRYERLALIEVIEISLYQALAVVLALLGYGVWSFVWATLLRGIIGAILTYGASPWPIRLRWDRALAGQILRYGLPFQGAALINNLGQWVTPTLVGSLVGPQAVGYLNWAASHGKKPLMLVDSVMRVSFPHFSRLQEHWEEVERIMVRYMTYLLLASGFWFVLMLTTGPSMVGLIFTEKWLPAVPALILSALAVCVDVIIWVVSVSLNALGFVNQAARRALGRTMLHIVLGILFVLQFGFNGVPIAYILACTLTLPFIFQGLAPGTMQRVLGSVAWIALPILAASLAGVGIARLPLPTLPGVGMILFADCVVFTGVVLLSSPMWLRSALAHRLPYALRRRVVETV